jgi:hypothetical protein
VRANRAAIAKVSLNADERANDLASVVGHIRNGGAQTLEAIADE